MNPYPNQMTLRSLKGAPVSILMSLHLTNISLPNKDLINWTGYSDKTIAQALDLLYGMGLVVHNGHRLGWSLTQKGVALFYLRTTTDGGKGTDTAVSHDNGSADTAVSGDAHEDDDDDSNAITLPQRRISATGAVNWDAFNLDSAWVEGTPPHWASQMHPSAHLSRKKSDSLTTSSKSLDSRGKDQRRRQTATAVFPQVTTATTKVPNTAVSHDAAQSTTNMPDTAVSQLPTTTIVPTAISSNTAVFAQPTPLVANMANTAVSQPLATTIMPNAKSPNTAVSQHLTTPSTKVADTAVIQQLMTTINATATSSNTAVSEPTTTPNAKAADTAATCPSSIVNRKSPIVNHHTPVAYRLLRQAGVGMTMSQFLSQLDWITPTYVRAHLRQIEQNNEPINYAIHRMREGDAMPICQCGRCDECHQRTVDRMGLTGVICR